MNDRRWGIPAARRWVLLAVAGSAYAASPALADCAPAADAPPFCLQATVTAGAYRAALVVAAGDKVAQTLHAGGMIAGWTLTEIGPRYIVVGHDEASVRLSLGDEPAAPPPVQTTAGRRPPIQPHPRNPSRPNGDDAYAK